MKKVYLYKVYNKDGKEIFQTIHKYDATLWAESRFACTLIRINLATGEKEDITPKWVILEKGKVGK